MELAAFGIVRIIAGRRKKWKKEKKRRGWCVINDYYKKFKTMMAGFVALTFVLFKQESQMKENIQL